MLWPATACRFKGLAASFASTCPAAAGVAAAAGLSQSSGCQGCMDGHKASSGSSGDAQAAHAQVLLPPAEQLAKLAIQELGTALPKALNLKVMQSSWRSRTQELDKTLFKSPEP